MGHQRILRAEACMVPQRILWALGAHGRASTDPVLRCSLLHASFLSSSVVVTLLVMVSKLYRAGENFFSARLPFP